MKLSLKQRLELCLHRQRADTIAKALKTAQEHGIDISFRYLVSHQMAGGDVVGVVNALAFAKEHGIPLGLTQASAIDLAGSVGGKHLATVLEACLQSRDHTFDTFSPDDAEPLVGFTRDGSAVKAKCTLRYRLTPNHAFGQKIENQHERIAVKLAILINKTPTFSDLQMKQSEYQQNLLSFASDSGVEDVTLNFEKA